MADKIIDVIPVGTSQTDFRQIKLVDKGDYFQVWRNGITYVGDIQEQAEAELWQVRLSNVPSLYAESRAVAAELACILHDYLKR